jgi:hypothetical protein
MQQTLNDKLSLEDWVKIGQSLAAVEHNIQWQLGDWWLFGNRKYGQSASLASASNLNISLKTLKNYAWVASRFELSRRRDNLNFSHHAEVCALPIAAAEQLLDRAFNEELSEKELRQEMSKFKSTQSYASGESATCTIADLSSLIGVKRFGTVYADPA